MVDEAQEISFTRGEIDKLPRDTLRLLLGAKGHETKKSHKKADLITALFAKPKPPKPPRAAQGRKVAPTIFKPEPQRLALKRPPARRAADSDDELMTAVIPAADRPMELSPERLSGPPRPPFGRPAGFLRPEWLKPRPLAPQPASGLTAVPSACLIGLAARLSFCERVRLSLVCRQVQRDMTSPAAWHTVVLDQGTTSRVGRAAIEYRRKVEGTPVKNRPPRPTKFLARALEKCTHLDVSLPPRPSRRNRWDDDTDTDSDDDEGRATAKRQRRQAKVEARLLSDIHTMITIEVTSTIARRIVPVQSIIVRGLEHLETKMLREMCPGYGVFQVAQDPMQPGANAPAPTFTAHVEHREPEPLDLAAVSQENAARAAATRASMVAQGGHQRYVADMWVIKAEQLLTPVDALLVRDFPMLVKVTARAYAGAPLKGVFHFTRGGHNGGHALTWWDKKDGRDCYQKVLDALTKKYPEWACQLHQNSAP